MSGDVRQQETADSAGGAAGRVVNIAARLRLPIGLARNPHLEPSECNAAGGHLASTPDFHALHLLCRLFAHRAIVPGVPSRDRKRERRKETRQTAGLYINRLMWRITLLSLGLLASAFATEKKSAPQLID